MNVVHIHIFAQSALEGHTSTSQIVDRHEFIEEATGSCLIHFEAFQGKRRASAVSRSHQRRTYIQNLKPLSRPESEMQTCMVGVGPWGDKELPDESKTIKNEVFCSGTGWNISEVIIITMGHGAGNLAPAVRTHTLCTGEYTCRLGWPSGGLNLFLILTEISS